MFFSFLNNSEMKKKWLFLALLITHFAFSQSDIKGTLSTEVIIKKQIGYALHIPKNTKEKKPLLIFIPGDGEKIGRAHV